MRIFGFICSTCKHGLQDDKEYCPNCGVPYEGILQVIVAAHYKTRIQLINAFLKKEGRSLANEAQLLDSISETLLTQMHSGIHLNEKTITDFFQNHETTET